MTKRIRAILGIAFTITGVIFALYSLRFTVYDSFREVFMYKTAKWYNNNFLTQYTHLTCYIYIAFGFANIPLYVLEIVKKDYTPNKWFLIFKTVLVTNAAVVLIASLGSPFFLSPLNNISLSEAFKLPFEGDQLEQHLIVPLISVATFLLCDSRYEPTKISKYLSLAPISTYIIFYGINVFGTKFWTDSYNIISLSNIIGVPLVVLIILAIMGVLFLIMWGFDAYNNKVKKSRWFN